MLSGVAQVNVELKARDPDPEATAARCLALGATEAATQAGALRQTDTYFMARRGRLKLRSQDGGASELIAYRRPDAADASESSYVRAPIADPDALTEALDATIGSTVVVTKSRRVFLWQGVRIHLDQVDGLGSFIEFEAVLPDAGDLETARAKVARLRSELGIEDDALVSVGYADLLMDGAQALLRAADGAMRNAYAPYSGFKVGAAVRGRTGAIYAGANVENASYPQGQCAEASALGALVAAGESAITAVAVVAERLEVCPPCGGCRQRLAEFGDASTPVHLGRPGVTPRTTPLGKLLPGAFGPEALEA
jgi:homotetrameric cytidine deaminase